MVILLFTSMVRHDSLVCKLAQNINFVLKLFKILKKKNSVQSNPVNTDTEGATETVLLPRYLWAAVTTKHTRVLIGSDKKPKTTDLRDFNLAPSFTILLMSCPQQIAVLFHI